MAKLNDYQFAVKVVRQVSRRDGDDFFEIEFIDPSSGEYIKTYISGQMKNSQRWLALVEYMEHNPDRAVCIFSTTFRTKRSRRYDKEILNADTDFEYEGEMDLKEFLNGIEQEYYSDEVIRESEFFAW